MAAQARALILSLAALCLPAFANVPRASFVAEKPRLGGESFALASHQGQAAANALIAPGLCECLYDSGRRSRSTGKERDGETGLDCFGARYMSAAQGRFTSPDPHNIVLEASSEEEFASFLSNPQNWNRYAYVTNNPLSITDPDGRCPWCPLFQRLAPYADKAATAAQRYGQQASQAAQRYGQQAYVWATQFFNSPAGQEAIQTGAELVTGASAGPGSIAGTEARIVANAAKGKAGEVLADIVKNTERIPSASGTAAYRIPDILDHANKVIGDVKNFSSKLSMSNQLRDFISYAKDKGYTVVLRVADPSKVSKPLRKQIEELGGRIEQIE